MNRRHSAVGEERMRKLSFRCSGTSPTPPSLGSSVGLITVPMTPPPLSLTPPPSATLTPPLTSPARRLVASRSLGSTASPPSTPPVTSAAPQSYAIPMCLPSHQHHARLPATPGPPSHRSLPALHPPHSPIPPHIQEETQLHSSHPMLINPEAHNLHGSHPVLHTHASPPTIHGHMPHSPPASRPGHFSHASALGRDHLQPRQLPGLPRHHTIGGLGSGRLLPAAPSAPSNGSSIVPQENVASSIPSPLLGRSVVSVSPLAARPTYALQSANYKYSLDVPRTNLRDLRSNTYPPPGAESPPSRSSSGATSSGATTSGNGSGGSAASPCCEMIPPSSPRLSPGILVISRVSPFLMSGPPLSPGRKSSISSSLSSSCATSPIPRVSPVPPLRSPANTSPSLTRASSYHAHTSPAKGINSSPTTPLSRRSSVEPPVSPLLRKTTRPPLMRSHATVG